MSREVHNLARDDAVFPRDLSGLGEHLKKGDRAEAATVAVKGCRVEHSVSILELGRLFDKGRGNSEYRHSITPSNTTRAIGAYGVPSLNATLLMLVPMTGLSA
jgi:hypothetical protein